VAVETMSAAGRGGRGGGCSGGRGSNSTSWKERIMAGKPTAPAAAVPTAATPLATPAAKPNANDDKSRANRLTGAGVESASPRLLFASQVLIGHTVEAQVRSSTHLFLSCKLTI
jgi:hypothetical protein